MSDPTNVEMELTDDYDEEADSDFDAVSANSGNLSSSSEGELDADAEASARSRKRRKVQKPEQAPPLELDSGDEATIKEHKRTRRRQKKKADGDIDASGEESEGWRARTRAMRDREKEEKKRNKLATVKGSTIDVNELWEDMKRIDFIPKAQVEPPQPPMPLDGEPAENDTTTAGADSAANKENDPGLNEMITIKRSYKFAGEVHMEEKTVLKSSAEARLWLTQQSSKPKATDAEGRLLHRPLRKISRFDPNLNNLESFKGYWTAIAGGKKGLVGPKLNVVEKSKMDWAAHVDVEGLKEELDDHAKAKEGYLHRMDFLRDVEQRREVEARGARLQGQ